MNEFHKKLLLCTGIIHGRIQNTQIYIHSTYIIMYITYLDNHTLWLAHTWFLKIVSVQMFVCVIVCLRECLSPEAQLIISGMI